MGDTQTATRYSFWFTVVVGVFITCLITANIAAVKILDVGGIVFDAGTLVFPLSYITGDVLTEVYGFRQARKVIWLGFICNLITVISISLGQVMPGASFWEAQAAYERILGYTPRLLIASFIAYLIGEFANSLVLAKMKVATKGRHLWARTIASTIVGEGLDSLVFTLIAFLGTVPPESMVALVMTQWIFKSVYEALATPLTYVVVNFIKRKEGIDTYDTAISFNPLSLAD
ncbi:MAG: queuosine precursor transporter [Anaerolineae bacterium]